MKGIKIFTPGQNFILPFIKDWLSNLDFIPHHRSPQFRSILRELKTKLLWLLGTKDSKIAFFNSSGSGAIEAIALSLNKKPLVINSGKFGQRWLEIFNRFKIPFLELRSKLGETVPLEKIEECLKKNKEIEYVIVTHCETSTGVFYDLESLGNLTYNLDRFLIVDAISTVGSIKFEMDRWRVDSVIGSSHKGIGAIAGLSFVSISEKLLENLYKGRKKPSFYHNLIDEIEFQNIKEETRFTPTVLLMMILDKVIERIKYLGMEAIEKHVNRISEIVKFSCLSLGLTQLPSSPSPTISVFKLPHQLKATEFVDSLAKKFNIYIGKGQGELKEKVIRITHYWYHELNDILALVFSLEEELNFRGIKKRIDYEKIGGLL